MNKNLENKVEIMLEIAATCENNNSCDNCRCEEQCKYYFKGEQPRYIFQILDNLK